MSVDCTNCKNGSIGLNFNQRESAYSEQISSNVSVRKYGSGRIEGYRYRDAVYMDKDLTQGGNDMEYFLITYQEGFVRIKGDYFLDSAQRNCGLG